MTTTGMINIQGADDVGATANERDEFVRDLTNHSCLRCKRGPDEFIDSLSEHECPSCHWAISVMRNARKKDHDALQWSFPWGQMYQELLPVLFGQLFFVRAHPATPGFDYLVEHRLHDKALHATLDAGGLVHMGYVNNNVQFQRAAVGRYRQAIHELRKSIEQPDADATMVMLCIIYLQISAAFSCIADSSGGWMVHGNALEQLMRTHGTQSFSFAAQTCFTGHMRMFTLWSAIMRRKRIDVSREFWVDRFSGCEFTNFVRFSAATAHVPGILEDCDRICRARRTIAPAIVTDCITAISALEGELHDCVAQGYSATGPSPPYWTVSDLPVDDERIQNQTRTKLFPRLYDFPNVSTAGIHANHWMCLLALRQAQLDIRRSMTRSRYPSDLPIYGSLEIMTARTDDCADNLCMCVPYFLQDKNGYVGLMCAMGPLHMALQWYRRQNKTANVAWCEGVVDYVSVHL